MEKLIFNDLNWKILCIVLQNIHQQGKAPAGMAVYTRIILCGPSSLSSHGAQRSAGELNGSCKNRWKKSRKRILPHLAVTVVWAFLSRVYPQQLKSLKMFVFAGKISHLSFIWGLVGQNRFHIWQTTQSGGFTSRCFPKAHSYSLQIQTLTDFISFNLPTYKT